MTSKVKKKKETEEKREKYKMAEVKFQNIEKKRQQRGIKTVGSNEKM